MRLWLQCNSLVLPRKPLPLLRHFPLHDLLVVLDITPLSGQQQDLVAPLLQVPLSMHRLKHGTQFRVNIKKKSIVLTASWKLLASRSLPSALVIFCSASIRSWLAPWVLPNILRLVVLQLWNGWNLLIYEFSYPRMQLEFASPFNLTASFWRRAASIRSSCKCHKHINVCLHYICFAHM